MAVTWKKIAYEADCLLKSSLTAKGALISASAANTPATLSVGTNGKVLIADSAETSGLKWDHPIHAIDGDLHTINTAYQGKYIKVNSTVPILDWKTPAQVAADLALDDIGVPDAAVDFNLQQATDLVVMTVANVAALPITAIAVGQICFATTELSLHICTATI